jgi:hypothetical protein
MHTFILKDFNEEDKTIPVIIGTGLKQVRYDIPVEVIISMIEDMKPTSETISMVKPRGWSIPTWEELLSELNLLLEAREMTTSELGETNE